MKTLPLTLSTNYIDIPKFKNPYLYETTHVITPAYTSNIPIYKLNQCAVMLMGSCEEGFKKNYLQLAEDFGILMTDSQQPTI